MDDFTENNLSKKPAPRQPGARLMPEGFTPSRPLPARPSSSAPADLFLYGLKCFGHFFRIRKHALLFLFVFVYVPWFIYLENHVTTDFFVIWSPLDDLIPFCEFFVLPYYAWYGYLVIGMLFIAFWDGKTCLKAGFHVITGMVIFLIISTVWPNGLDLRPDTFARDNFCTDLVRLMYSIDTPTNVFPSLHVYNSISMHAAIASSPLLKRRPKIRHTSLIVMILIILSTVFIKQHSVIDVVMAIALGIILYFVGYVWLPKLAGVIRRGKKEEKKIEHII